MRSWPRSYLPLIAALIGAPQDGAGFEFSPPEELTPSAWIFNIGGYGVVEPFYEGARSYTLGFKPQIDIWRAGDREWPSFPNDAVGIAVFETSNFRAGPAGNLSLQSPYHGQDIDLRVGKANADLAGGVFAEYYPMSSIRIRAELLQGITGNSGFATNLFADFIWRPEDRWTLTLGPRAQIADVRYASQYFAIQNAFQTGAYTPFHAEGGLLYFGAEVTGKYALTQHLTAIFFIDLDQLAGDAADNPRVSLKGSPEQFIAGLGLSYKVAVEP